MSQRPAPQLFRVHIITEDNKHQMPGHWELDDVLEALKNYSIHGVVICNVHPDVNQGVFWVPPHRIKRVLVKPVVKE